MANIGWNRAAGFYCITLGLALIVRLAVPVIGEASLPMTMLTPTVAAVIMLSLVAREGTLRQSVTSLGLTRAGVKAWPLAIAAPALIFAGGLVVLAMSGAGVIATPSVPSNIWPYVADVLAGFLIGIGFSLFEEIGWRGYLLPRMPVPDPWLAMFAVGFLHGLWHLPLLLTTRFYHSSGDPWIVAPLFLATLTLAGGFYGFLRTWTASVWPVAIAHGAVNSAWTISNQFIHSNSATAPEYIGGESGVVIIMSLLVFNLLVRSRIRSWAFASPPDGLTFATPR